MLTVIAVLLIVWIALMILGALVEGLLWLAIIGAILFAATAAYGAVKRRAGRQVP